MVDFRGIGVVLFFYAVFFGVAAICRWATLKFVPEKYHLYFLAFISAWTIFTIDYESGHVRQHYGVVAYWFAIVVSFLVFDHLLAGVTGNIIPHIARYLREECSLSDLGLVLAAHTLASCLWFVSVAPIWNLQMCEHHLDYYQNYYCYDSLMSSVPVGFAMEFFGTMFELNLFQYEIHTREKVDLTIKLAIFATIFVIGGDYSGFYLNPLNATKHSWSGCGDHTNFEYLLVFWGAPILGAIANHYTYEKFETLMNRSPTPPRASHPTRPSFRNNYV